MQKAISRLHEQKHLLNQIDLYIYSKYLDKEDVEKLLTICKTQQNNRENLLNEIGNIDSKLSKKYFSEYVTLREKFRDTERDLFKKIFAEFKD